MNIGIFRSGEIHATSRRAIVTGFEDLTAAEEYARKEFDILHWELDPDCENCADFITKGGDVYAVEHV